MEGSHAMEIILLDDEMDDTFFSMLDNLSDWQHDVIRNYSREGQICMTDFWNADVPSMLLLLFG